jgi:hypothetical protein
MEVQGKIKMISETQTIGDKGFKKRELVVTSDEQYPQHILIEFVQDKCEILNAYKVGQAVTVGINLRGREWVNPQGESKYFNQIQGWKINKADVSTNDSSFQDQPYANTTDLKNDNDNGLPF